MSWDRWIEQAVSLRRFLLAWLLGGLWGIVALITAWQAGHSYAQLARAQDARLAAALAALPPAGAPPSLPGVFRVSTVGGDWQTGERALPVYPWAAALPPSGAPRLYMTQLNGTLMRGGAALRAADGTTGAPLVLQVAAPWRERWPAWHQVLVPPLQLVYAAAAAMSLIIWAGVAMALRWLDRARAALQVSEPGTVEYTGPAELRGAVAQVQELQRSQRRWVDEQRRFLADASHQLRTPMAVLRTQLQSAIAGDVQPADILPQMLHTVDRASGLADQLLSLTKLEQLKRQGDLPLVDLHAAARDAVLELAPLVAAKRLDFSLEGSSLRVPGDAVMLGELFRNLLANAIHHTPHSGRLGILLRRWGDRSEFVVWDEGPGVDDTLRPRLFQPFSAAKGGVGLGLSICRQIAEAMGARMDLFNRIDDDKVIGVDAVVAWG